MSLGPSSLGNMLAQRLDTVLGIGQSGQVRTGAHPDALRQTQPLNRLLPSDQQRGRVDGKGNDKADQAGVRDGKGPAVQGRPDPRLASQLQRFVTDSRFTASAPTTLGRTARTILSLLSQNQNGNQAIQGKAPLLQPRQLAQALLQQQQPATTPAAAQKAPVQTATNPKTLPQQTARPSLPPLPLQSTSQATQPVAQQAVQPAAAQNARPAAMPLPTTTTPSISTPNVATLAQTVGGPTTLVSVFMQALNQNVQQSGLFYESHLAQLVKGQADLPKLQQQPQAQAHLQTSQPAPTGAEAKQTAQTAQTNTQSTTLLQQQASQTVTTLQQSGIDPSTQQIVRQQLEVLANQMFVWRGEAWPGTPMEWEVQRRHEDEDSPQDEQNGGETDQVPWQTRLRVELPQLGEVEARLFIADKSLRMHIRAPDAAQRLNLNLQQLVQRLTAQGIDIQQLQIARHDEE